MALKMVSFGFILMDSFSPGSVPQGQFTEQPPMALHNIPKQSGEDDKGKGMWRRGNDEAGQASLLLLCHPGHGLRHSTSLRHIWPCCSLLLRDSQMAASVRPAQLLVG